MDLSNGAADPAELRVVDNEVLKWLPEGSVVIRAVPGGLSGWCQTSRVTIELPDGTTKDYFHKTCDDEIAAVMMEGEFRSLSTLKTLMPNFVPQPHSWGECKSSPGTFFLIMDFIDLEAKMPDPEKFAALPSELHQKGESPTGMFGFDLPSCHGKIIQPNTWNSNWCSYFTQLITVFYEADMAANGPNPAYEEAFADLKTHVIPRLLEPLQAEGRVLRPSLVHGDLWEGNVGVRSRTGDIVVYDASCSYAHHEYELDAYLRKVPKSEPTAEWNDRNRLYCIKFNLSHWAHWLTTSDQTRQMLMDDMQYLNSKYAPNAKKKSTADVEQVRVLVAVE